MVWYVLHHAAVLYKCGFYDKSAHLFTQLLAAEHGHPGVIGMIHRFMYSINPDWGM